MAGTLTDDQVRWSIYENLRDGSPTYTLSGDALARYVELANAPELTVSAIVTPKPNVPHGRLIAAFSVTWLQVVKTVTNDWTKAHEIGARQWEE
ncbi:hypothetical protein CRBSH125_26430 [Afipia carboxidovorans]|nr:hypothetical protein CRBSH125_26430 [Afipia carboxidovorans]